MSMKQGSLIHGRVASHYFTTLIVLMMVLATQLRAATTADDLDLLLGRQQYQKLELALRSGEVTLSPEQRAYFNGIISNRLNQAGESIQSLEPVMPKLLASNLLHAENALCTLADDYIKKFRYSDGAAVYAQAATLSASRGATSLCNAGQEARRWALLAGISPQTVQTPGVFTVQGTRNAMGLIEIPVQSGSYSASWVLDTGANLSIISRSVADQMGLSVSRAGETGEGSSGIYMPVHVALIPELHLGPAVIRNMPVLVIDDSDLKFPSLNYNISGCLGLPVLAALKSVSVSRDAQVTFGNTTSAVSSSHNLFLERLTVLLAADLGHGNELFSVDTGAIGTVLSVAFYEQGNFDPDSMKLILLELSGAGGSLFTPAYQLEHVPATIDGTCVSLPSATLLIEKSNSADEFYGTIGQNLLQLFESYTFDFEHMQLRVSEGAQGNCPLAAAAN